MIILPSIKFRILVEEILLQLLKHVDLSITFDLFLAFTFSKSSKLNIKPMSDNMKFVTGSSGGVVVAQENQRYLFQPSVVELFQSIQDFVGFLYCKPTKFCMLLIFCDFHVHLKFTKFTIRCSHRRKKSDTVSV